jgi:hypothetical protein
LLNENIFLSFRSSAFLFGCGRVSKTGPIRFGGESVAVSMSDIVCSIEYVCVHDLNCVEDISTCLAYRYRTRSSFIYFIFSFLLRGIFPTRPFTVERYRHDFFFLFTFVRKSLSWSFHIFQVFYFIVFVFFFFPFRLSPFCQRSVHNGIITECGANRNPGKNFKKCSRWRSANKSPHFLFTGP